MTAIAIVTPWYGPDCNGGAESLAREMAQRLAMRGIDVTLLTTCSRSFLSRWDVDYFEPGEFSEEGVRVRRFRVAPRDAQRFDDVNAALLALQPHEWPALRGRAAATAPFIDESINSPDLEAFLAASGTSFDAVLFIPYLFGVVVRGIAAVGNRAHLIPCLHDEAYARIPSITEAVHRAATLLYNSDGEAELALRIFGPGILHKGHIIGSGLDAAVEASQEAIPFVDGEPFVLYLGRRDATKNVDFLIAAFDSFKIQHPDSRLRLVLAGPGNDSYSTPSNGVIDLGFVSAAAKQRLLQQTIALLQPSTNESYSRVVMEAWRAGKPVVVHRDCLATATAVRESGGGRVAQSTEDLSVAIRDLTYDAPLSHALGAAGREYAVAKSDWDLVIDRLLKAISPTEAKIAIGKRVDQVVQTLEYGDAISDYATHVRNRLRDVGYDSTIWAEAVGPLVLQNATIYDRKQIEAADVVIYHHSIGAAVAKHVQSLKMPKALIYHNITPASFFAPYRPAFARLLEDGRTHLPQIVDAFDRYIADSEFNAQEIRELGVERVETVPVLMDFARFDVVPDVDILADESAAMRWLFVGRVAPNKGIRSLIFAFEAFLYFDHHAQLYIVGRYDVDDPYYLELQRMVSVRRLERYVHFSGIVTDEQLTAHYQRADIFITLSEHEGFCVPVIEAMLFDLPVVALASTALPETLGRAGLLVEPGASAEEIASLVFLVRTDHSLATKIIDAQRERRESFMPRAIYPMIDRIVSELLA